MGLLSRASTLDQPLSNPGLAFSDFINRHSIKACALLEKQNNDYVIANSIGFDALSILSATSTVDFWEGICKTSGQLYNFSDSDKTQLLQLFSFNLKDSINEISVYKTSAEKILLCIGKVSEQAVKDFELVSDVPHKNNYLALNPLIKDNSVVLLFNIDFETAVKSFYENEIQNKVVSYDAFVKSISNEVYNRFACRYSNSDTTIHNNSHSIKTVLITEKTYSVELMTQHILLNLKEVLGKHTEEIKVSFVGTADSCDKVQTFLQAE